MLTQEQNDRLTRVGPGTPAGDLLRRYWLPVAVARELTEEQPVHLVRMLGENLALFRDRSGAVGLIDDRCAHRGASLSYGRVEERGLACAYHGWLYDVEGNCLETPAEPRDSRFRLTVRQKAYPVRRFIGLYWTYMGPQPQPLIPDYDLWARRDGKRAIHVQPRLDCNWFQAMENSVDPAHLPVLHQDTALRGRTPASVARGFTDDVAGFEFYEFPLGIMKRRTYTSGHSDEHPLIFPNILRQANCTQIRVPIDDTHTRIFFVRFHRNEDGRMEDDAEPEVEYVAPYKDPPDALHPFARFRMDQVQCQDHMAWETQGPIADRTTERLATSDRGIVMLREMMNREMDRMEAGNDPKGVMRDPEQNRMLDTRLAESLVGPELDKRLRQAANR